MSALAKCFCGGGGAAGNVLATVLIDFDVIDVLLFIIRLLSDSVAGAGGSPDLHLFLGF